MVQNVQALRLVQNVQTPSFILPRDAGEETGGGLNGAKRLNDWNGWNYFHLRFLKRQHKAVVLVSLFVDVEVAGVLRLTQHRPLFGKGKA
jgi:hypothetical protein